MAESQLKPGLMGSIFLFLLLAAIFYGQWQLDAKLADVATYSGWTLVILSFLLTIHNLRKKISTLPIGRAWYWRKAHSFIGWLAVAIFFIHAGPFPPEGRLNLFVWFLYLTVLLSGIAGLWLTLSLPPRIASGGERLQFERIPHLREAQFRHAERVVLTASADGLGQPLLELYEAQLRPYLSRSREFFRHGFNNAKTADQLLQELKNIGRYIDKSSRQYVEELEEIITLKQNLDRQYALQNILKKWTYIHIALNYMSWIFILMHVLLIYTFRLEYGL